MLIKPLKRFALFTGSYYYPVGGWDDLAGCFETLEQALAVPRQDWFHIIDLLTGEEIAP